MVDDSRTLDTLFGELRHWYRRQILTFFSESERDTANLDELIEHLNARRDETSDPERLGVVLHHEALPALADAGLIEYDAEAHTIRYGENCWLESALDLVDEMKA